MTKPKIHPREHSILIWLSRGWSYTKIAQHLKISSACLHVHCHHLRKKTGIKNTKHQQECIDYLYHRGEPLSPPPVYQLSLSWTQLEVLRLLAEGGSYGQIAQTLHMGQQTAQNHASAACKRAGIRVNTHAARLAAIKAYIAERDGPPPQLDDPML